MHQGMTSSDVLDTCLAVQLVRAADLLLADVDALLAALKRRAFEHKHDADHRPQPRHPRRAHHLRPEARQAYAEFARARSGWSTARAEIATCAISGAVGTFANVDPAVEAYVAEKLGLAVEPVSTQVIPRDRHAVFFATLARRRLLDRAARDRDPPPAAHRGAGGRGVLRARARRAPRPCRTSATRS